MASRVELVFEKVATLPQAKTTPQINPVPPKSNPGHGGRLRFLRLLALSSVRSRFLSEKSASDGLRRFQAKLRLPRRTPSPAKSLESRGPCHDDDRRIDTHRHDYDSLR
jgi:hypothetical protein